MIRYTLNKLEKLKSRKSIESLFAHGNTLSSPPLKLLYRETETGNFPALMTVAVPKKLIKRAVDRNLIKRRIREAYRLRKPEVYDGIFNQKKQFELLFLYQASEITDFNTIKNSLNVLLIRLMKKIEG